MGNPQVDETRAFIGQPIVDVTALERQPVADFRGPPAGVYALFSTRGNLLYIGQSGDLRARLRQHLKNPRMEAVASVAVLPESWAQSRLIWETILLAVYRPPLNAAILLRIAKGHLSEIRFPRKGKKKHG